MLDMQPAFIRRLDTEGVVCPARSPGGQRRYSRTELDHIAALAGLMSEGMTVRPNSELVLQQYQFKENATDNGMLMQLVRGGFRAEIGRAHV